ncbi:AI-2E family transporter [Vagococcus penaei]|uniref:AI-2E family transporter n=1 Tax=Vagococcus penaei TaxID=633807 RepID=A0A1Q2D3Y3_9ENTE|nr:AI-2E family transporter [Vagococcus penaei]AQP53011.1 AI-2E family transporter [Vagococcus penaei]RSU02529.1 AI-2E family transporter [Vagococcus penaei]
MLKKVRDSKLMFWSLELLILATLIFVGTKINFLFQPLATMFTTLFAPILISGFFFYLLNPLVVFFTKKGMKRSLAVALVMLLLVGILVFLFILIIPNVVNQLSTLISRMPATITTLEQWVNQLAHHPLLQDIDFQSYLDKFGVSISGIAKSTLNGLGSGFGSFISSVAGVVVLIVTVPFMLFYMLKDGQKFLPMISKYFPEKHKDEIITLLNKMSGTISKYISGQMIECAFVAVFTFLGYMLIGVDYAFLFGIIAGTTNMIPYIGPYLGLAPAVLVTVFADPWKAILACIVVLIVQQIDGNIVYPNVIGKSLDIHPLTIIILLLVAGNIAGLLGMILGVPLYAVCKTVVIYVYDIIQLNKSDKVTPHSESKLKE